MTEDYQLQRLLTYQQHKLELLEIILYQKQEAHLEFQITRSLQAIGNDANRANVGFPCGFPFYPKYFVAFLTKNEDIGLI